MRYHRAQNVRDTLLRGCEFGKFRSKKFPTAEDFMKEIEAYDWFDDDTRTHCYGVAHVMQKVCQQ